MRCLKCGERIPDGGVFCDSCLEKMRAYPVPPGIPIQLPRRSPAPAKRPRKPEKKAEEQIARLNRSRKRLIVCIVVLCTVIAGLTAALFIKTEAEPVMGRNYQTGIQTTGNP